MNIIEGVVSTDSESGKKFATVSGTLYRTFNAKKAASGKYTLVVRARKGGNNPKATLNFIIRNKLNGSDNNWLWPTFNLTDEFVEYSFSFNYTPSETNYVHQYMLYLSSQKVTDPDTGAETTVPYTAEIDSIAFYYKPFDDYERPQYGELIAWEGYETADIGSSANGSASVYNSNTTSGVTGIGFPGGTVYAEAPTGNRYIVTANTVYYPSIAPSVTEGNVKAKAGVYTHVVRARKGTGSSRHLASEPKSITVKHGTMVGVTQKHSH